MHYTVLMTERAKKSLAQFPPSAAAEIYRELTDLSNEENPKRDVRKLKGNNHHPIYSFRVGSYRVILNIEDTVMVIHVIETGNRNPLCRGS
ncbi:type II toxin-antitoxin system RelE family toxin [Methanogenium cariaci]|jgi:mRNA interferase RelE/StbE